ncbi:MAG TPA: DUF402 domain-containing protein [Pyrinomonadaceae bacterium]|nr:DUF402 domain-containing protein [Pyrinomonadaceae bacterium]
MSETRFEPRAVVVRSLKYDGREHRRWRASLTKHEGPLIVLDGIFEQEVEHALLGNIRAGTQSTEYFWTDRFYSVFRFREPDGAHRNYYCNVNTPPTLEDDTLSFVDLDIDVLVAPDFTYQVLDEDEFALHSARYGYPEELRARARAAVAELIELVERRLFPFDGTG